jgi:hypothetical protein
MMSKQDTDRDKGNKMNYEQAQVAKMLAGIRLAAALEGLLEVHDLMPSSSDADYIVERVRFLKDRYREEVAEPDRLFAALMAEPIKF